MISQTRRSRSARLGRLILVLSLMVVLAGVSACGRKNANIPPEGSSYPQDYPTE